MLLCITIIAKMAYLARVLKDELIALAVDLGVCAEVTMTKSEIIQAITRIEGYDEEYTKAMLEAVQEEKGAEREAERAEREAERTFELEKLRLTGPTSLRESTPEPLENSLRKASPDLKKLMPRFNIEDDITAYLAMFELQAKNAQIGEAEWASQLLALLPLEVGQIVLRESEEDARDYKKTKQVLLDRYRLTPEAFRLKFIQHSRKANSRWVDFAHELRGYFDSWVEGLNITSMEGIKQLIVADQFKERRGMSLEITL